MLTVRATLKDNVVTFIDRIDLTDKGEQQILITFLESSATGFEDLSHHEVVKLVSTTRFNLSDRELEVLKLAQQGLTNEQIADQLEISNGTVRNYLSIIYDKLKVNNRTGAIAKAMESGLLD